MTGSPDDYDYIYGRSEVQFPQLELLRPDLEGLPSPALPEGYAIRPFRKGDESAWAEIITGAFGPNWDVKAFKMFIQGHYAFKPGRVLFVCFEGEVVGTASAFAWPGQPRDRGYIHMVAVKEECCGAGLGCALTAACLRRFKDEGDFNSAMLQTETWRLPAIKHYLRLGFRPILVKEYQREQWIEILNRLDMTEKIRGFGIEAIPVKPRSEFYSSYAAALFYMLWLELKYYLFPSRGRS